METCRRIAPEWINTLKENEIFVFGCRNSGRHFDGASNFALKHFGLKEKSTRIVGLWKNYAYISKKIRESR